MAALDPTKWRFYNLFSYPPISGWSFCLYSSMLPGQTPNTGQALLGWNGVRTPSPPQPLRNPLLLGPLCSVLKDAPAHFQNAASHPSQDALGMPGTPSILNSDDSFPPFSLPPDQTSQGLLFIPSNSYSLLHTLADEADGWMDKQTDEDASEQTEA